VLNPWRKPIIEGKLCDQTARNALKIQGNLPWEENSDALPP